MFATVFIPAAAAGLVAVLVTVAIERWGGRIGGLLGTLPTTIVPAAAGIWWQTLDPVAFGDAMAITPVGMWVDVLFLLSWRLLPPRLPARWPSTVRLAVLVGASLALWFGAAAMGVATLDQLRSMGVGLLPVGAVAMVLSVAMGAWACRRNPPSPAGNRVVGPATLVARGLLAAVAIGAAVLLARVVGPLLSGVMAVFPAIFLTTMVSLWFSQGERVQAGAVGPMMLGASSVSAYALFCAWTIPLWGVPAGSAMAWFAAVCTVTVPAWRWLAMLSERRLGLADPRPVQ